MSQTKVSNIESGKLTPSLVDVELILEALGVDSPVAAEILSLARTANTEWQDHWSSRRRGLDKKQNELARIEAVSTEFRFFLLSMITGLLATPEYVRASISDVPGDQSKTIAKKLERQQVLYESSKSFTFILSRGADVRPAWHGGHPVIVNPRTTPSPFPPGPGCALCATPGVFGPHSPANPHSGLCPACVTAGMPTREGLESAVVIVAGQTLAGAESLRLSTAAPEELAYHLGAVKRSLRSVLQLLAPPG